MARKEPLCAAQVRLQVSCALTGVPTVQHIIIGQNEKELNSEREKFNTAYP